MVKVDDAQKQLEAGWGGPRQKRWAVQGKRAVVNVDPVAYEFVVQLARLCHRPNLEMCAQIFAAGLESLTGYSVQELCTNDFTVRMKPTGVTQRGPLTHEQVRAIAEQLVMVTGGRP